MIQKATWRIASSRVRGTYSSTPMPITGRNSTRLRTRASRMAQAPPERRGEAAEDEEGVEVQAAGLHAPEHPGGAAAQGGEGVQGAVEDRPVAQPQEDRVRDPQQRAADEALVGLVDE